MFTIDQIKAAHSKVKSGADFPAYVQVLKKLGVTFYDNYVADGRTHYNGLNDFKISGDSKYSTIEVANKSSKESLRRDLAFHQKGGTDYLTFCKQAGVAGVEKWRVDITNLTCTYYDKAGTSLLVEEIPLP